jgi:hypothetical protein
MRLEDDLNWMIQDVQSGSYNKDRLVEVLQGCARYLNASAATMHCIEQTAAQAIGTYPWYKDDQKNFPGSTEMDGVCIGEHVTETIVAELADNYRYIAAQLRLATKDTAETRIEKMNPLERLLAYAATLPGSSHYHEC